MATMHSAASNLKTHLGRLIRPRPEFGRDVAEQLRARWQDRRPVRSTARFSDIVFSVLVGAASIILPLILLGPLADHVDSAVAVVVFMVAIGVATHLGEWPGAITAILVALLATDVFWIGDRTSARIPRGGPELLTLSVFFAAGLVLAWLIQEVKNQSLTARRDAQAARSATFALNSIEADAAAYARHGSGDRAQIYGSLLRAMVAANRTAFGVLLLVDEHHELVPVAEYGIDSLTVDDLAPAFLGEIVEERRLRSVYEIARDLRFADSPIQDAGIRSVLGCPIFGGADQIVGIVLTGLHASHRFSSAEEYRLTALADKASSILAALTAVEERETALKAAEERQIWLERVIEAMPEAVVLVDLLSGFVIAQNDIATALLGDGTGQPFHRLNERLRNSEGEPVELESSPVSPALTHAEAIAGVEMLAVRADGASIPVLVSAAPVEEAGVESPTVVIVFREISALKEASRLKDEFVSIVSHELRSPLTPILGFVQLVARDLRRKGGHADSVKRLDSAAGHVGRMTRLVDDLLDVSRLKAGLLDLRRTEVNLGDICREVMNDRKAGGVKHAIVLRELPFDVVGNWDADRIYQVIDNLVSNAVKYSPADGTITISMDEDPASGKATVTVEDEGPGIAAEERQHLFSAFFRTKSAASSQVAGLGLGLYICHELVFAHGGSISVHESAAGGAAFRVELPVAVNQAALKPAAFA